jgi:hypothetical protein
MKGTAMKHLITILLLLLTIAANAAEIHVRPDGAVRTLAEAQREARKDKAATVVVHAGAYYLPEMLVFTAADSGTTYVAAPGEKPVISGGMKLDLQWQPYKDGIMQAKTPSGLAIDQLFVNGQRQMMARYPNYDPNVRPYGGYAADAFSKERAARWADPVGGYIHAMHRAHWGGYHYRITGKNDKGEITYEGGWQNNRQMGMHKEHRFVENIFEELDAPGEWFHNAKNGTLYYYPSLPATGGTRSVASVGSGHDGAWPSTEAAVNFLNKATIEVVRLRHLVEFNGAKNVTLRGFVFQHAARTFMDVKEPLLRSDWTIYRGGAVLFNRAEDCTVADCEFDQLGGNAIFVNGYNRRIRIVGCDIHDTGASAVAFVGESKSVRNPLFEYNQRQDYAAIDKTPGPKTEDYPADCVVEDCLIRHVGVVEKQATGVELSMALGITLRHCSIYDASRAGINVSEGTFGGHVIEFCDVFDTVRETGDHGSFNSWGRDRFWGLKNAPADELPKLALLDVVKPNVIRNSRWRCDHGWDVDLDDGSSNYEIYNNLFLHGGLKLREGFHRRVWNNIAVNNTLHPHVWYENSGDIVTNNIWMGVYRPAAMKADLKKWGRVVDYNLFTTTDADRTKFTNKGCDEHSLVGDAMFVDPAKGDYRVKDNSPVLKLGFKNFPMDQFGVQKPELKKIARTPELPVPGVPAVAGTKPEQRATAVAIATTWQGAVVRNLEGEEYSAFGVSKESGGVHLKTVPAASCLAQAGLQTDDLIQGVNGKAVHTVAELFRAAQGEPLKLQFVRGQGTKETTLADYVYVVSETTELKASGVAIQSIRTKPDTHNESVTSLYDGKLATNYGPVFANGTRGMYKADLGKATEINEVCAWSFNMGGKRGSQNFALFGSASADDPGWDVSKFQAIAEVNVAARDKYLATAVRRAGGKPLGSYRWLMWMTKPVTKIGENTAFQEFQIK